MVLAGCSSSDDSSAGSGGASGSGGTTASGGTAGSGGGGADTWTSYAKGFFETYCWECHGPGDTKRDYSLYSVVVQEKDPIACGVATTKLASCGSFPPPKQFPIDNAGASNPKPSDAERERLIAWLEAGAPE